MNQLPLMTDQDIIAYLQRTHEFNTAALGYDTAAKRLAAAYGGVDKMKTLDDEDRLDMYRQIALSNRCVALLEWVDGRPGSADGNPPAGAKETDPECRDLPEPEPEPEDPPLHGKQAYGLFDSFGFDKFGN